MPNWKVGDVKPPRKNFGNRCPSCDTAVLRKYKTGYVNEYDQLIEIKDNVLTWRENWHCPNCGYWDRTKKHQTDSDLAPIEKRAKYVSSTSDDGNSTIDSSGIAYDSGTGSITLKTEGDNTKPKPKKSRKKNKSKLPK